MLSHLPFQDRLTLLYCLVDDLLALLPGPQPALDSGKHAGGRPAGLAASEVLSLALFRCWTDQPTWKAFYGLLASGFRTAFPGLPCYETFVRQVNRHGPLGLVLLVALLGRREAAGVYALDATAVPVSRKGRRAKVVRELARWGRDSEGHWYFGFKLHAVCDQRGRLCSLRLTAADVADVTQAEALLSQLRGLAVADAAYISSALRAKLWQAGLLLLTPLRKNMKGLASLDDLQHLRGRQIIETVFSVLKLRLGLVTSLPRSLAGYLTHYVLVLVAYQLSRLVLQALAAPSLPQP